MATDINELVETITPEYARLLLEQNTRNRKITNASVDRLAKEIRAGRWVANGDAIRISKTGVILDGQHRLMACVWAKMPIQAIILTNLDDETQASMDCGIRRTLNTQLQIYGVKSATNVAALINLIVARETKPIETVAAGSCKPSITQGVEYYKLHPEIVDYTKFCLRLVGGTNLLPASMVGLLHREFTNASSEEDATAFFEQALSGTGINSEDSATNILRNLLILNRTRMPQRRFPPRALYALVIKAWNKFIAGESCAKLQWHAGGAHPEPFPHICDANGNPTDE